MFDRFDPGAIDDIGTSAVVILDLSGSMAPEGRGLSDAFWAICHVARSADIDLTVIGFGTRADTVTLFDDTDPTPGEMVRQLRPNSPSTDPRDAVAFALAKLTDPDAKPNRLCLIMTDGSLDYMAKGPTARAFGAMSEAGISTGSFFYGSYGAPEVGADLAVTSDDLADLVELFGQMAFDQMARNM
jgi:hypothetical protein